MKNHKHKGEPVGELLFSVNPLSPIIIEKCKCGALKICGRWYVEE